MRSTGVAVLMLLAACSDPAERAAGDDDGGIDRPADPDAAVDSPDATPEPDEPDKDIFDESKIWTYDLTVAPEDWAWLNANALLEEYVAATVEVDGETYPQAAVRFKGNAGSLARCFTNGVRNSKCVKLSMKLSFDEYDEGGKYHGVKKLNLHAMLSDPSKIHEAIGYKLFRDAGVPAPRTTFARVVVNGEDFGLYSVIENVDGRFARARFPDGGKGNVYKEAWPNHEDAARYLAALETNADEGPSVDKIVRFADDLDDAGDAGFRDVITRWTDVDQLVSYFAVARLIDHWDDVVTWYCVSPKPCLNHNFFWYESTTEDRLTLIAWDLDHTFEEPSPLRTQFGVPDWDEVDASCDPILLGGGVPARAPACDPLLRRIVTQLWDEYYARSMALIEGDFSEAAIDARVDELKALLKPYVDADPFLDPVHWHWGTEDIRSISATKAAYIANKLAP
jgi:hypothetical protein